MAKLKYHNGQEWEQLAPNMEEYNTTKAEFASYAFGSRPYTATYTELYLDEVNGSDSNDGLTQATAVKTWSKLHSLIPVFLNYDLTVKIIGDYSSILCINSVFSPNGYIEAATLTIEGYTQNKNNHNILYLRANNVLAQCVIRHITTNSFVANVVNGCLSLTCQNMTFNVTSDTHPTIQCINGNLYIRDSELNNTGYSCINAAALGVIFSRDNTGQGKWGLQAYPGGTIIKYGNQPTGTTADENTSEGGLIR